MIDEDGTVIVTGSAEEYLDVTPFLQELKYGEK